MVRTVAFVDALNLYHGIAEEGLLKYRWLNIEGMVQSLAIDAGGRLSKSLKVDRIVYCTSLVSDPRAARRQDIYLQALEEHCPSVEIFKGKYEQKERSCEFGHQVGFQTEKQTDVNLAVQMVFEASRPVGERSEVQLLITGDTDLVPAVAMVRQLNVDAAVIAPPSRGRAKSSFLPVASTFLRVGKRHLRDNPLPDPVEKPTNSGGSYPLRPPDGWTRPEDW